VAEIIIILMIANILGRASVRYVGNSVIQVRNVGIVIKEKGKDPKKMTEVENVPERKK